MRTRVMACLFALLMLTQTAMATDVPDAAPVAGTYAASVEEAILAEGLALETEVTFVWGGLPLLDEADDAALGSLLKETALIYRRQGAQDGEGYRTAEVRLQGAPVLDLTMQVADGVYYEQSNVIGGQTVAFTAEDFQTFVARMSARGGGALPANLDSLFSAVMRALGGGEITIDNDTLSGALAALHSWEDVALVSAEQQRPTVFLPGMYGVRATVVEVTREELLTLAEAYSALLAENDELWRQVAEAEQHGAETDEETIAQAARQIAQAARNLPMTLAAFLPEDLPAAEYREVFDAEDALIVKQLDVPLPDGSHLYVEWAPRETGIPPLYMSLAVGESTLSLMVTREDGALQDSGRESTVRNRMIAQWTYVEPEVSLDVVMTRTENVKLAGGKETGAVKTDWMIESAALFGEGTVVTVSAETTSTASGEGKDYKRATETVWRTKGLDMDGRDILTVSTRTTGQNAQVPADPVGDIVWPAQMTDAELDVWLEETQVSAMQAMYTVMGRLPSDVARYLLTRMAE